MDENYFDYTPDMYIQDAIRTESLISPLESDVQSRLLHAAIGISTEAGELLDTMKKTLFYNKPLDDVNFKEELGDLLWYIAIACNTMECTFEELMETNIKKLKVRFPEKFTTEHALHRDLDAERKELEKGN